MNRMICASALVAALCVSAWGQEIPGWTVKSGTWTESDGVITGKAVPGETAWLMSDAEYYDFSLTAEFRTSTPGNGGIQFRSHWLPNLEKEGEFQFYGYQANVETRRDDGTATVLDEKGRGPLVIPSPEAQAAVLKTDWNTLRIEARGPVIEVWVNGVRANRLYDEQFIGGYLGLQAEPQKDGEGMVEYRNIQCEDHGRVQDWQPLFNGSDLSGWQEWGTEDWSVENGVIEGKSGPDKSEGYLLTDGTWTDFRVKGECKMLGPGNYGLFYRSTISYNDKQYPIISGIQGEVDPGYPGPSGWHYESYRRGWIFEQPDTSSIRSYALRPGEWNAIEIRAIGNRITSWINGIRIVDFYDENPQVFEGGFALQLHAGGADGILWKELYVTDPQ